MILMKGPTGRLIKGHVLDVDRKKFEEALRRHDPQLYTRWNPNKVRGWGCWEIRRKPDYNSIVEIAKFGGNTILRLEPAEVDVMHHVLDCAFLNYDQIRKIKEMDTWRPDHWIHDLEYGEEQRRQAMRVKAQEELKYAMKQNKRAFQDFKELVRSGHNPARIMAGKGYRV